MTATADARTAHEQSSDVSHRIGAELPHLSDTMTRLALYLLENPAAPVDLSISELAARAGTSAATVTRFCRMLGYTGYVSLRVAVATDAGRNTTHGTWETDIGRAFGPDDPPADVLSSLMNAHWRTLRETAAAIDLTTMTEISTRIAQSVHVDIYGVGGSAMLADEMEARLYRIGINTRAWSEVHAGLTSAAIQGPGCVAIGISNTGRTEETIQMLAEAGRAGALTVAITNNAASPLADAAELTVTTSIFERFLQPDDLSAKHGQLLVLDLLYLLIAQRDFDRSTRKLAASARAVAPHRRPRRVSGARDPAQDRPPAPGNTRPDRSTARSTDR